MAKMSCIGITFFMLLTGIAKADLTKDREECGETLISLSVCLPYVGGDSKAPTMDCCTNLKSVVLKNRKCLCVLIKDHDDPDLGLKINATLALGLPVICQTAPTNVTECLDLLHLEPNSKSAKLFLDYANSTKATGNSSPVASGSSSGNATSNVSTVKNDGGQIKMIKRLRLDNTIIGVLIWCMTFHVFYNT